MTTSSAVQASAPGRICLFGEHQDYLGLPVVAMAVTLRFRLQYRPSTESELEILTPDLPGHDSTLDPNSPEPRFEGDFLWGAAKVLRDEGFRFPRGGSVVLRSEIPVKAGCSSSSAMTAAFLRLLVEIGEHPERHRFLEEREHMALLTYRAEKELFGGAGGMMDQYACYLGGLIHVYPETAPAAPVPYGVEVLMREPEGFLLIDSGTPKDTQGVLRSVGDRARKALSEVRAAFPDFDLNATAGEALERAGHRGSGLRPEALQMALDQIVNRDLCREGLQLLRDGIRTPEQQARLGAMLTEEHRVLSETLGISTPQIDRLCSVAVEAGALGAKINGSGGGGTAFCYAPGRLPEVEAAVVAAGGRTFRIRAADGASAERNSD